MKYLLCLLIALITLPQIGSSQEENLTGIELSVDQDFLADFLHDDPAEGHNYTAALRIGIYGELANHIYLGLPWVRSKIDYFLIDRILDYSLFGIDKTSHNFVFTVNGFSPTIISDENQLFWDTLAAGYRLENDLPFSSFTGFRSTRRLEVSKYVSHSASQFDMGITSSFSFGLASLGLIRGVENLFGANRPDHNLWVRDEDKLYPTGQLLYRPIPIFMYSLSVETVLWRPLRQVLFQLRPEINIGYYGDVGLGLDFGKVLNTERLIDNLSYTDLHNPGTIGISDQPFAWSLVGGGAIRSPLYNAHVHGMFGWNKGQEVAWSDTKKYLLEAYAGIKLQFFSKIEVNFSINTRSPIMVNNDEKYNVWGTVGLKYLMGTPPEGCYD